MNDGTVDDALFEASQEMPPDQTLAGIALLAQERGATAEEIEAVEQRLSELRSRLREYDEIRIPQAMAAVGMTKFTLDGGIVVSVEPFTDVYIKEEDRAVAYSWLKRSGYGDLVKHELTVGFSMGEDERASTTKTYLEGEGFAVKDKETVHPGTLRAFVREQIRTAAEQGRPPVEFPDEFKIYQGRRAKMALPK